MSPNVTKAYLSSLQLPNSVVVAVSGNDHKGYSARVMNLEGCSTQADTLPDLLVMINDALYTYFEIPESQRSEMPRYRPRYEAIREKIVTDSPPRGRFALQLA